MNWLLYSAFIVWTLILCSIMPSCVSKTTNSYSEMVSGLTSDMDYPYKLSKEVSLAKKQIERYNQICSQWIDSSYLKTTNNQILIAADGRVYKTEILFKSNDYEDCLLKYNGEKIRKLGRKAILVSALDSNLWILAIDTFLYTKINRDEDIKEYSTGYKPYNDFIRFLKSKKRNNQRILKNPMLRTKYSEVDRQYTIAYFNDLDTILFIGSDDTAYDIDNGVIRSDIIDLGGLKVGTTLEDILNIYGISHLNSKILRHSQKIRNIMIIDPYLIIFSPALETFSLYGDQKYNQTIVVTIGRMLIDKGGLIHGNVDLEMNADTVRCIRIGHASPKFWPQLIYASVDDSAHYKQGYDIISGDTIYSYGFMPNMRSPF